MSNTVRDVLFIFFFIYIFTSQYIITNYEKVNGKLTTTVDGLMGVCVDGGNNDLLQNYRNFE